MNQFFTKIASLFLAIVVLLSTMSFTIDKHYCGKVLVDVAINAQAKKCGMEMAMASSESSVTRMSCCKNEHLVIAGQDELKKNLEFQIELPVVLYQKPIHNFQEVFLTPFTLHTPSGNHDPPDKAIDFHILYETYLI